MGGLIFDQGLDVAGEFENSHTVVHVRLLAALAALNVLEAMGLGPWLREGCLQLRQNACRHRLKMR